MRVTSVEDPNEPKPNPTAPLIEAAEGGDLVKLGELLAGGMPVDPPAGNDSAFLAAVMKGKFEAAQLLLDAGADVNRRGIGLPPLESACQSGLLPAVEFLINAGASLGAHDRLLSWTTSSKTRAGPVLALLARSGLDPNTVAHGSTSLLMEVCRRGDIETARLLLDRGADPNLRLRGTALTAAEENGHQALVDLLLERGARPERADLPPDAEWEARLAEALEQPTNASRRLAWAETLLRLGMRAAAASEVEAATKLGAEIPSALRDALTFENPPGTRWRFAPFELPSNGVARAADPWVPGARVTTGSLTLPLVFVLGAACTRCDEKGEIPCSECDGTGTGYDFLLDKDYACSPRMDCLHCRALKYVVSSERFGRGVCKHEATVPELIAPMYKLVRCTACGLAAFDTWGKVEFACGVCGRFECRCFSAARR